MLMSLLIAGFGGQGVLVMGKLLSQCAFEKGTYVTFMPSYGPQMRGGTSNCTVTFSDREIGTPVSEELDALCALNQVSFDKFKVRVKDEGIILTNSSLVQVDEESRGKFTVIEVDADNMAYAIGSPKVSNIIMLAAYVAASQVMPIDDAREVIIKSMSGKPEYLELNIKAFDEGTRSVMSVE